MKPCLLQAVQAGVLHVPIQPAVGEARREVVERWILLAPDEVEGAGQKYDSFGMRVREGAESEGNRKGWVVSRCVGMAVRGLK